MLQLSSRQRLASWLRIAAIACCAFAMLSCSLTVSINPTTPPPPSSHSYHINWTPGAVGFPNVTLTLEAIIPPQQLDLAPSNYVRAKLKVGDLFEFSTDDPRYRCVEAVAVATVPILFFPESELARGLTAVNDFLVAYQRCSPLIVEQRNSLDALAALHPLLAQNNYVLMFHVRSQRLVSKNASGNEYSPIDPSSVQYPTSTPSVSPTVAPSPSPASPMLSVRPGNFSTGEHCSSNGFNSWVCLEELTNTGGGTLNWTASNSDDAQITPSSGTLPAGQSMKLTIYFACNSANFTLTFSGPTNTAVALVQVTNVESCH